MNKRQKIGDTLVRKNHIFLKQVHELPYVEFEVPAEYVDTFEDFPKCRMCGHDPLDHVKWPKETVMPGLSYIEWKYYCTDVTGVNDEGKPERWNDIEHPGEVRWRRTEGEWPYDTWKSKYFAFNEVYSDKHTQ